MSDGGRGTGGSTVLDPKVLVRKPPMFKVLLHNDDYTSMEFVVEILVGVFNRSMDDSVRIMLNVHNNGTGVAGVYTAEIAETKISVVESLARADGFPLKCSMQPE